MPVANCYRVYCGWARRGANVEMARQSPILSATLTSNAARLRDLATSKPIGSERLVWRRRNKLLWRLRDEIEIATKAPARLCYAALRAPRVAQRHRRAAAAKASRAQSASVSVAGAARRANLKAAAARVASSLSLSLYNSVGCGHCGSSRQLAVAASAATRCF